MGLIGFDADVSWTIRATGVAQTPKTGHQQRRQHGRSRSRRL